MRGAGAAALLGAAAVALGACGDDDERLPAPPITTTTSSAGGGSEGGGGAGGEGGGQGGQGGPGCGDGVLGAGEACDGAELNGQSCQSLGFDAGDLACAAGCVFDTSACSGVEQCQDGSDNDGDGAVDCNDNDCAAVCAADPCASAQVLPDPALVNGDTAGHAPLGEVLSCADPGSSGPSVAYQVTAMIGGFLDVSVTAASDVDLGVAVRDACASAASELSCASANAGPSAVDFLSIPVAQGETVYLVVSGVSASQSGGFSLEAHSRVTACGDASQDPGEACDDGNTDSNDGCSAQCALEPTEVEPNGLPANANPLATPFFAAVSPAGDQDVISVAVPSGSTSLVAQIGDLGDAACGNGLLDSVVEILDPSGASVLASDDNAGAGLCSSVMAPGLAAGTYFVRVKAAPGTAIPTFPYQVFLDLIPDVCGDMNVTPGEQCDDGNTAGGDGCGATCQLELDETEPNDTAEEADPYAASWLAAISPALDVDVVSVVVPGPSSTLLASVGDAGTGTCAMNQLDSYIEILGPGGGSVIAADDDSGPGYCSFATASGLAAGTYLVRIKAAAFQSNATFFYSLTLTTQ